MKNKKSLFFFSFTDKKKKQRPMDNEDISNVGYSCALEELFSSHKNEMSVESEGFVYTYYQENTDSDFNLNFIRMFLKQGFVTVGACLFSPSAVIASSKDDIMRYGEKYSKKKIFFTYEKNKYLFIGSHY